MQELYDHQGLLQWSFESEPLKNEFGVANIPFKKTFKFLVPTKKEIKLNSRARSAKLRSAIKT